MYIFDINFKKYIVKIRSINFFIFRISKKKKVDLHPLYNKTFKNNSNHFINLC